MALPLIHLDKVLNFRDVGVTINRFLGERRLREGVFFRSARLDEASSDDVTIIAGIVGAKTIVDLRTKTEHLEQARKLYADPAHRVHENNYYDSTSGLLRIPGLEYHEIKVTGRAFERHILNQLTWWNFIKFLVLYLLSFRMHAIAIIGREVMAPRGLVGLGLDTVDHSGREIRQALSLYTDSSLLPSIVHCTHGKDRTGLICALVLMILGVPLKAIEHDYLLTDAAIQEGYDERLAEIRAIGLPDHWAGTSKDMIIELHNHIEDRYGGLRGYLDSIGFLEEDRAKVTQSLLY